MKLSEAILGYEISSISDGYSPLTIAAYKSALGILADFLFDPDVQQIKETDLKRFFGHLRTTYEPGYSDNGQLSTASLHRYWKAVRSFFKWAENDLKVPRPDLNFKTPKYNNKEIIPYSENDVQKLIKACQYSQPVNKDGKKTYRFRLHNQDRNTAIVLTLLDTGIRPGEICRLKISDVNLTNGEIQIRPYHIGKTRPRVVIIGTTARKAIWKYLSTRESPKHNDPMFLTDDGHEMTRYTLGSLIADLGQRAGVSDANPYRFRHTFAIQYLRNGGDVFTLQRLLGHATMEMTRRYLMIAQCDTLDAHRRASPVDRWRL